MIGRTRCAALHHLKPGNRARIDRRVKAHACAGSTPVPLECGGKSSPKRVPTARVSDLSELKLLPDSRGLHKAYREFESSPLRQQVPEFLESPVMIRTIGTN